MQKLRELCVMFHSIGGRNRWNCKEIFQLVLGRHQFIDGLLKSDLVGPHLHIITSTLQMIGLIVLEWVFAFSKAQ